MGREKRTDVYIVNEEGAWMIAFNGKQFGPCKSKEEAIDLAAMLAIKAVARGVPTQVQIEEDGKFRPLG